MAAMAFQLLLSWSLRNECKLVYTENFMIFGHSGREFERISSGKFQSNVQERRNFQNAGTRPLNTQAS
jgi:hypothetical protein